MIKVTQSGQSDHLYHYTSATGLSGILKSNSLWACSTRFSNDSSEFEYAKQQVYTRIHEHMKREFPSWPLNEDALEELKKAYGSIDNAIAQEAQKSVDIYYKVSMRSLHPLSVCFCSHESSYEQENGLLSQWRGYGDRGGYALVFNKNRIQKLMKEESDKVHFNYWRLMKVEYKSGADLGAKINDFIDKAYPETEKIIRGFAEDQIDFGAILNGFMTSFCFIKNPAFHEEKEWRLVFAPDESDSLPPDGKERQKAQLEHFNRSGLLVPYIQVFGGRVLDSIERIVIGPHAYAERRRDALAVVLRQMHASVPVSISTTPLVE